MVAMPDAAQPPAFEAQIRPMFRERDRESMRRAFDLWSPGAADH